MKCNEVKLKDALGGFVNGFRLGAFEAKKGHRLTEENIASLKKYGVENIFCAFMEDGDINYETALGIIAAKICGDNTAYSISEDGICRIISTISGIFTVNEERVAKFNRINHNIILNIAEPYVFVNEDDIIATIELSTPIIPQQQIDDVVFRLSGNISLLSVHNVSNKKAAFIYSRFSSTKEETRHFTDVIRKMVKDFPQMNMEYTSEYESSLSMEDLANTLQRALRDDIDIFFILPGQRNSSDDGIIIKALNSIADEVVCVHIPQVGGSDLIIAEKKKKRIIVVPYNYQALDTSYAVRYIKQAIVADKLSVFDFNHPQNYLLKKLVRLEEGFKERMISSENTSLNAKDAKIAAVVLAAGIGSRAGRNKLLVDIDGKPLFLNALQAAIKSKASPVFLVTGHNAEQVEEFVEDIDVNVVYNSAYRSGIRTSIDLALKSVPDFCNGAILIPADMPNITPTHINALISAFDEKQQRQLIVSQCNGIKNNPVVWSKELYNFADIVPENADLRPIFMQHADYTKSIQFKNKQEALDVTYPSDIEELLKKTSGKAK